VDQGTKRRALGSRHLLCSTAAFCAFLCHCTDIELQGQTGPILIPPTARRVPFPQVRDWNSVRITLLRTGCFFGKCPAYQIEIYGNGTILYEGEEDVLVKGRHRTSTTPSKVRELVNAFREADYYSLQDDYEGDEYHDVAMYQTCIEIDGQVKHVSDWIGKRVGMPASVSKLEESIDALWREAGVGIELAPRSTPVTPKIVSVRRTEAGTQYLFDVSFVIPDAPNFIFDTITVYGLRIVGAQRSDDRNYPSVHGHWKPTDLVKFSVRVPKEYADPSQGWKLTFCVGSAASCYPSSNLLIFQPSK